MKVSGSVKAWLVAIVIIMSMAIGKSQVSAYRMEEKARRCGSQAAVEMHFRAIIGDGETQSDWLTHLPAECRTIIYLAGLQLNNALDHYEVPELDHVDTH